MRRVRVTERFGFEDDTAILLPCPQIQATWNLFDPLPSSLLQVKDESLHERVMALGSLLK